MKQLGSFQAMLIITFPLFIKDINPLVISLGGVVGGGDGGFLFP